jgi:hypothetical protein
LRAALNFDFDSDAKALEEQVPKMETLIDLYNFFVLQEFEMELH